MEDKEIKSGFEISKEVAEENSQKEIKMEEEYQRLAEIEVRQCLVLEELNIKKMITNVAKLFRDIDILKKRIEKEKK